MSLTDRPHSSLEILVEDDGHVWTLAGTLDLDTRPQLELVASHVQIPTAGVVMWMDRVTFMDVAGWHGLRRLREHAGVLRLIAATGPALFALDQLGAP